MLSRWIASTVSISNGLSNWNMEELQNVGKNEGRTEYTRTTTRLKERNG